MLPAWRVINRSTKDFVSSVPKMMNIKPVTDLLDKMGITDEQLDAMDDQMAGLIDSFGDSFDMGGAQSMPFMQMFNMPAQQEEPEDESELDGDYAAASWKAMSRKKQTAYSRRTDAPQRKSASRKRNAKSTSSCPLTVKT